MKNPLLLASFTIVSVLLGLAGRADAIPAFARRYSVPCATCHTDVTRRNDFGDAFFRAGYRWPTEEAGSHADDPLTLSSIAMKGNVQMEGMLPASFPAAVVTTLSTSFDGEKSGTDAITYGSPSLRVVFGGPLSRHVGFFGTWPAGSTTPNDMLIHFNRLANRPELNLRVGLFEQMTTLARKNEALVAPLLVATSGIGGFAVGEARLGVELDGTILPRTYYAIGLARGLDGSTQGAFAHLSQRIGGMNFRAEEPEFDIDAVPTLLDDLVVTLAAWGWVGDVKDFDVETRAVRRAGFDARMRLRRVSLWGGAMVGADHDHALDVTEKSLTMYGELAYRVMPGMEAMYLYQHQDSNALMEELQQHDAGVIYLILENVRARAKVTYATGANEVKTGEVQLLYAF